MPRSDISGVCDGDWTRTPDVTVLGGEAHGRWLDREGGVLRNEIGALSESCLATSTI